MFAVSVALRDAGLVLYVALRPPKADLVLKKDITEAHLWESQAECEQWLNDTRGKDVALFYGKVVKV